MTAAEHVALRWLEELAKTDGNAAQIWNMLRVANARLAKIRAELIEDLKP